MSTWAGLAAAWLLILGVNLAAGRTLSRLPTATVVFSRQELLELRAQQQMLANLISPGETAEAEPLKKVPSPRSERRKTIIAI